MQLDFLQCFSVDRVGNGGGLTIFWKQKVKCIVVNSSLNHIDVTFSEISAPDWRFTYFYGFPESGRRKNCWDFIHNLVGKSLLPWCVFGDFNDMLY